MRDKNCLWKCNIETALTFFFFLPFNSHFLIYTHSLSLVVACRLTAASIQNVKNHKFKCFALIFLSAQSVSMYVRIVCLFVKSVFFFLLFGMQNIVKGKNVHVKWVKPSQLLIFYWINWHFIQLHAEISNEKKKKNFVISCFGCSLTICVYFSK